MPESEAYSAFSPSTISRRVHRRLEGLPLRRPGRPRDTQVLRRAGRLEERLKAAEARLQQHEATLLQIGVEQLRRRDAQLIHLLARGNSLRGTEDCLRLGFGALGLGRSAVAEHFALSCAAARELFDEHFAGKGRVAAGDEVYLSGHPVLEMVEPRSLAITGLKPHTEPTRWAWETLLDTFPDLYAAVSDEGRGLRAAILAKLNENGLDHWHLTRAFAAAVGRLELAAYAAIEEVDRRLVRFIADVPCAPGPKLPDSLVRLENAQRAMAQAIDVFDAADTVWAWLSEAADPIDAQGRVRSPQQVVGDWNAALDLVDHIPAEPLYAIADKLRGKRDGAHLRGLRERIEGLSLPRAFKEAERGVLQALGCQAWHHHHRLKTHLLAAPVEASSWVAGQLGLPFVANHLEPYLTALFETLDRVLKASSAVECVNSIFRLGQGAKRHPHPDLVFLLAWLHNTQSFKEGRRKGLTPAQLLGVCLPKDGWTMLLDRICVLRAKHAQTN